MGPLQRSVSAAAAMAESLLERRNPGVARRLTLRERRVELTAAALLIVVAAGLATQASGDWDAALPLVLCYALVRRIRFALGPGLIRPTQLVFVPMLFLTPAEAVPALVALGGLLGDAPDVVRRRAHPERLAVVIADGWYSIGPALVVAALGAEHSYSVLLAAFAAQLATDFVATLLREGIGAQIAPGELVPVLALVYLIDALLTPIGFLAVLATDVHEYAYLLAIAPGALLGLITRERSGRIAHELALERAFRRSTRALDARAEDLRRQAGRLQRPDRRVGETSGSPQDREALERLLLATTVEALQADGGRLSEVGEDGALHPRLSIGGVAPALEAAERSLGTLVDGALAVGVGHSHVLAVLRAGRRFDAVERDLLEHLAAQAAVSLENLHLEELMRRTEAELRAILEGVADAVAAEDPEGRLVYVNAAAAQLLDDAEELKARLGVPAERAAEPLVVRHVRDGEPRWSRVKTTPVVESGLAISVIEDITEIKQAEEAQRFLSETSRALVGSLDLETTLPEVARLAVEYLAEGCVIELDGVEVARAGTGTGRTVPIPVRDGTAGTITLAGAPPELAEDLALRVGAAVENARLYRTRAAIAQTLQRSLLPPELPEIPGVEAAALYRPTGEGNEVGGDFYDLFSASPREWFAVIGDVCGKGAEAATVTALARYSLRAAVMRHRTPAGILRWTNAAMLRQRAGRFVTLACVRLQLDESSVTATAACGGHPCPRILRTTGLVEELGTNGTVIGVLGEVQLADRTARLAPGDAVVLYTDGLTEASAPAVWTPRQLDGAIAGARRRSAQEIVGHLAAQTPATLRDDMALLVLRVQPLL
ncbi:MAG TPA: SpoIIE family protein phosphatase [Solirubrobacter sp.]|nr:SpoIIE family protein phosphatase [Solirubrobacter sp.]